MWSLWPFLYVRPHCIGPDGIKLSTAGAEAPRSLARLRRPQQAPGHLGFRAAGMISNERLEIFSGLCSVVVQGVGAPQVQLPFQHVRATGRLLQTSREDIGRQPSFADLEIVR